MTKPLVATGKMTKAILRLCADVWRTVLGSMMIRLL
jgi:hypothetical protein